MKKGFTLIELLAVIVILAIISLIAVPIILKIINDSKKSSEEQSLELYKDSVQKAIAKYQMTHPEFNPSECQIKDNGNVKCGTTYISVDMKGKKPNSGMIAIKDNKVKLRNIVLNENKYYFYAKLIDDADNNDEVSIGDKYTYKVNDTDTFNFYVLSLNNDDTVNLIMDRNICNDGTTNYTSANNYCRYAWYAGENNNLYGPVTSMQELYSATKNWLNVPDMIMDYNDESNFSKPTYGYKGIYTDIETKVTTIVAKNEVDNTLLGNKKKPLKARLPKGNELSGCSATSGSCPTWLIEHLRYYDVNDDKYSINNNNEAYQYIDGYWAILSHVNSTQYGRRIYYRGSVVSQGTSTSNSYGVRPVITVPLSDLQ